MKLNGREVGFLLTVKAMGQIAALCPGGELRNLNAYLSGEGVSAFEGMQNVARVLVAMGDGYYDNRSFSEPDFVRPRSLSEAELLALDVDTFKALRVMGLVAFNTGVAVTVEIEPEKKTDSAEPVLS